MRSASEENPLIPGRIPTTSGLDGAFGKTHSIRSWRLNKMVKFVFLDLMNFVRCKIPAKLID
jgi:hypothetical protein